MDEIEDAEVERAEELGELIGSAVCAVIDYYLSNSDKYQVEVESVFGKIAKKLVML